MNLNIDEHERKLLADLLESRITEMRPEIRRSREHGYKDGLKAQQKRYEALLARLRQLGTGAAVRS